MSPKGGIKPHKRFSVQSNRSEVLFVDYIAEHLTTSGRAAVIVPEGIIFQSGTAYKQLRKMLVEKYLYAVASLPAGVFNPYSGVKTSVLFLDPLFARKNDSILFVKIENDGFSLGAQRRAIDKNDLPEAIKVIKKWRVGKELTTNKTNPHTKDNYLIVSKEKIAESGEYNLTGERYRETERLGKQKWPTVKLGDKDLFSVESGGTPDSKNKAYWDGDIHWATLVDLPQNDHVTVINDTQREITGEGLKNSSAKIIKPNSVIVSTRATIGRIGINKIPICTNQGFKNVIIKDETKVNYFFLAFMIKQLVPKMKLLASGGTFKEISKTIFCSLEIPLPPIEVQREIVTEIEDYQKIIDGARQVVENWKPHINIDPDWQLVKLGEICQNVQYGLSVSLNTTGRGFKTFRMNELVEGRCVDRGNMKCADINENEFAKYSLRSGDILFNRTNSFEHVGRTGIFDLEGNYSFASYLIRLRIISSKAIPPYVNIYEHERFSARHQAICQSGNRAIQYKCEVVNRLSHSPPATRNPTHYCY
jgi:type I restriction enzyme M protein